MPFVVVQVGVWLRSQSYLFPCLVVTIDPFLSIRFPWYYWRSSAEAWRSGSIVPWTHFKITTIPRVTVQCVHVTLMNILNRSSSSTLELQYDNIMKTRCSCRKGSIGPSGSANTLASQVKYFLYFLDQLLELNFDHGAELWKQFNFFFSSVDFRSLALSLHVLPLTWKESCSTRLWCWSHLARLLHEKRERVGFLCMLHC